MAKSKITYDVEEDILTLTKGIPVKSSVDVGDFVVDVDHKGFVSGVEILNASSSLHLTIRQLKSVKHASMTVTYKPNYVNILLFMQFEDKEKDLSIPLTLDLGHKSGFTDKASFAVA